MCMATTLVLCQDKCLHQFVGKFNFLCQNTKMQLLSWAEILMMPLNNQTDRVPARNIKGATFKCTNFVCDKLNLIDVWRFFNPNVNEFTWNNSSRTQKSRIDLWLISNDCLLKRLVMSTLL